MAVYARSLNTDFGGNINEAQLHSEITAESGISPTLIGISVRVDNVDIIFDIALSAGEEITLGSLISAHTADTSKQKLQFYTVSVQNREIDTTTYSRSTRFSYPGSDSTGNIDYIDIVSRKDEDVTSYDVRLIDRTNNALMAEVTELVNNNDQIIDLGAISNIPIGQAILEIHIKKIGGIKNSYVHIDNVVIYHGN